ncbi:hypothetical protein ACFSO7_09685 [Bacillus sp. CGMCC 1.16607]|uniref:hypothetical protein n=1 Tax=Bacillus sp. CGMCC 1.16607 TaxID=3351842 RepID=UPI00362B66E3
MKFVENSFGLNDYFILILIVVLWAIYFLLPIKFSKQVSILIGLYCITVSSVLDNTFGALAFDYYDIMDGPDYTIMDIAVYLIYPPFGLFFIYLFEKLRISRKTYLPFIFVCSLFSLGFEWFSHLMNVFEYKNGYGIRYSLFIYIIVQSLFIAFYKKIRKLPI